MATPKQQKLIKLLITNLGKSGETKTLKELLLEAGYSEAQAKNPYQILESETIKKAVKPVADDLDKLRQNALNELKARDLSEEQYRDIVKAVDLFTKNHQLLTGEETERQGVSINVVKYGEEPDDSTSV